MKLTKKDIQKIEDLGWSYKKTSTGYFLDNYSPAGGEICIEESDKEGIIRYCEYYDANEEFDCWYGAKRGEPSLPSDLWEDCLAKGRMLDELKQALQS